MNLSLAIIIFIIGFISSFVGTVAGGGGGLISMPFLIFIGLPPNVAIATNRFGNTGMGLSAVYCFFKDKKIVFKYVWPLVVVSIAGSVIGANILLKIDQTMLGKIMGVVLLLLLPMIIIKNDVGLKKKSVTVFSAAMAFGGYFLLAIYDGFLGAGAGLISLFMLASLLGMTYIEANATDKIPWFLNTIISTTIFAVYGLINYLFGIFLLAGMILGGYVGATAAIKKGNHFVKLVFGLVIVASAVKLLFF